MTQTGRDDHEDKGSDHRMPPEFKPPQGPHPSHCAGGHCGLLLRGDHDIHWDRYEGRPGKGAGADGGSVHYTGVSHREGS